jgi:hypothetical protein
VIKIIKFQTGTIIVDYHCITYEAMMQTFTDKKTGSLCNELNLLATYD